jgi:hypothetical protein
VNKAGTALTGRALKRYNAWAAIRKRARNAGFLTPVGCHTWRATGVTVYLENGGIHLFADKSLSRCTWAQTYYQHHRQKDRSHANALRRLGHRWLKIIHKMWMDRTLYDPELHHRNQLQHGSWIFQLKEC